MPVKHQKYLLYNKDDFIIWAQKIGGNTEEVIRYFLEAGREPGQGYKSCVSLMKIAKRYSDQELEDACGRILAYTFQPNVRNISTILKNSKIKTSKQSECPPDHSSHGITRGAAYFNRKGGNGKVLLEIAKHLSVTRLAMPLAENLNPFDLSGCLNCLMN